MISQAAIQEADKHIEAFTLATYGVQQAAADVEKMERVVREYTAKHEELMKRRDDRKLYYNYFPSDTDIHFLSWGTGK